MAPRVAESLIAVGIGAGSAALKATLIDPHAVGLTVVGYPCVEIAIAIEVTEGDTEALGVAVTAIRKQREVTIGIIAVDEGIPIVIDAVGADLGDLGVARCGDGQAYKDCPEEKSDGGGDRFCRSRVWKWHGGPDCLCLERGRTLNSVY